MNDSEKLYPRDAVFKAAMDIILNAQPLEDNEHYCHVSTDHIRALELAMYPSDGSKQ